MKLGKDKTFQWYGPQLVWQTVVKSPTRYMERRFTDKRCMMLDLAFLPFPSSHSHSKSHTPKVNRRFPISTLLCYPSFCFAVTTVGHKILVFSLLDHRRHYWNCVGPGPTTGQGVRLIYNQTKQEEEQS